MQDPELVRTVKIVKVVKTVEFVESVRVGGNFSATKCVRSRTLHDNDTCMGIFVIVGRMSLTQLNGGPLV